MRERETTLDRTLKPLADLLEEYKRNLAEFDKQHVGRPRRRQEPGRGTARVEQRKSQDETRRLNQLLGAVITAAVG